jgi:hypothetical protein
MQIISKLLTTENLAPSGNPEIRLLVTPIFKQIRILQAFKKELITKPLKGKQVRMADSTRRKKIFTNYLELLNHAVYLSTNSVD